MEYTLIKLKRDEWANAHIAAATFSLNEIKKAEKELIELKIFFKRNDVPYTEEETAYRIFVFGTDILKLDGFKKRYLRAL